MIYYKNTLNNKNYKKENSYYFITKAFTNNVLRNRKHFNCFRKIFNF